MKVEDLSRKKKGKRVYLNDSKTKKMMKKLNDFLTRMWKYQEYKWVKSRPLKL